MRKVSSQEVLIYKLNQARDLSEPSFMVAGYPSRDSQMALLAYAKTLPPLPGVKFIPPLSYHITIRHWKCCAGLVKQVARTLAAKEKLFLPLVCPIIGLDIFGEEQSLVCLLQHPYLNEIFKQVDWSLQGIGLPPSSYVTFKPHLTLAEGFCSPSFPPPPFPVEINRWGLQDPSHQMYWSFQHACSALP